MNILVTGSSGMLGNDVVRECAKISNNNVIGIDRSSSGSILPNYIEYILDLTDSTQVQKIINKHNPDIIIHLAAIVNLKLCEENFSIARSLHVDVSRFLARQGAKIIYISTDSVFNGEAGNYTEESIPDPLNNYGITKYLGELAVRANNKNSLVIRTNIFGYNNPLKASLAEWALKEFNAGKRIYGYSDVMFNAIYTKHLARIIIKLIEKDQNGLINIASKSQVSKYDFLVALANAAGFPNAKIGMSKIDINENSNLLRPLNTTLCVDRAQEFIDLPTIESGIFDLANDFKKECLHERI